ncbi:Pimeloyl-ACP methyl ester carboxylesterase [Chishuiella changwenlii]|uniref:Arylesterase n=1 Tax=Chishuiella changwenlii TaxID=1434701 RepID=A0A1M6VWX0_9FLAO|nr:alpha/beta hydrolase [Chishuiella changwenlii]GGE89768.1 arylesterase [Chishuiella changwenlii]SHK85815.1 Pimeloyl-ACP methyl ester carboxylesterase [Chishuiella changwenlii]
MAKLTRNDYKLNYVDYGDKHAQPVILIHGWPLSLQSWEYQIPKIVEAGFRCIAYDRKGFGKSCATWEKYDYNALAEDLHALIDELQLNNVILVGFSMGGGEVVRYISNYGNQNISKIALISSIIPLVKKTDDNEHGVPQEDLDGIVHQLETNRLEFLEDFHKGFYSYSTLKKTVSKQQLEFDFSVASHASPIATLKAALSWMDADFRTECRMIEVPTLIIHGKDDQTVPIETAGDQAAKLISNAKYIIYDDAPHGLNITHKDQLNMDLLEFLLDVKS